MPLKLGVRRIAVLPTYSAWLIIFACSIAICMLAASPAAAQSLSPGATVQNPAAAPIFPNDYDSEALNLYDSDAYSQLIAGPTPFAALGGYLGANVFSSVYRDPSNGDLAFMYQFVNSSVSTNDMARMTINGTAVQTITGPVVVNSSANIWLPFSIPASGADGTGVSSPAGAIFSTWNNGNPYYLQQDSIPANGDAGLVVAFDIGNLGTVMNSPNQYSANIWFATNAQNFQLTDVGLSDSSTVGTSFGYGPAGGVFVVPEPSTIAIALIGFGMLAAGWRRRRPAPQA